MLAISLPVALFLLAILGACVGAGVNLAAYTLAWHPRPISPWSMAPQGAPPRSWLDRVPIIGWFRLRREDRFFRPRHWVRPMLVELGLAALFAWLYWWEVERAALVIPLAQGALERMAAVGAPMREIVKTANSFVVPLWPLQTAYFVHLALIAIMLVATLIDIDERLTSDAVLVPGTILGLVLAAAAPWSSLSWVDYSDAAPVAQRAMLLENTRFELAGEAGFYYYAVNLSSPRDWPASLDGAPRWRSLAIGLFCYGLWCFALLDRPWYTRHGWRRALAVSTARMVKSSLNLTMLLLVVTGLVGVTGVWLVGGERWAALLTSLVGMIGAGGMVWAIRLVGRSALGVEAMGFGDVLFMMMVGSFLGWQAGVFVFFLAPVVALAFAVVNRIVHSDREIFFVPFLAAGTLLTIVFWAALAAQFLWIFAAGWWLLVAAIGSLALIWLMLVGWRLLREALWPDR